MVNCKDFLILQRKRLGLSQNQVGKALGIQKQTYGKIESGKASLHPKHWGKLANVLKITDKEVSDWTTFITKEEIEKLREAAQIEEAENYDPGAATKIINACVKELTGEEHNDYPLGWDAVICEEPSKRDIERIKACFPLSWKIKLALVRLRDKYDNVPSNELKSEIDKLEAKADNLKAKEFPGGNYLDVDDSFRIISRNEADIENFKKRAIDKIMEMEIDGNIKSKIYNELRNLPALENGN